MAADIVPGGYALVDALAAEGIAIPADCRHAEIVAPVDGAMFVRFECFLTTDTIAKVGRALVRLAGPAPRPRGDA